MKKLFLILLLLGLTGCATYDACMKDPGCKKDVEEAVAKGSTIGALAGALGGPGGAAGGGLAGSGLGVLYILYAFRKKMKKKEENNGAFPD